MDNISVKFTFELENGSSRIVTINDVSAAATEAEIAAVGNNLIEKRGEYKGSPFKSIMKTVKISTTEEVL